MVSGFGNFRCRIITNVRRQGGDQHQRIFHQLLNVGFIGCDAHHTMLGKRYHCIGQQADGLQHIVSNHRFVHIQFKMALAGGNAHRDLIAHHLRGDHGQSLALCGIDFTRHDG